MKNTKLHFALTVICILLLFMTSSGVWAYRGCEADRCRNKRENLHYSSDNIDEVIKNIKIENNKQGLDGCVFDYFMNDDFEIVVFCRKHGSGSNSYMLSNMSVDSYFGERFNKTAFYCMCFLFPLAVLTSIVRSFKKKRNQN